ncbi:arginine--tRNA ligase [Candidatus Peregrinibacteria bacterium]|jgi:arginyl-tRNA synthetase|nr:arginine--tRNA ligase [Candidatus Peregrinibacteria bacterium]
MTTLEKIQELVQRVLEQSVLWEKMLNVGIVDFQVTVEYPRDPDHGDYAVNSAMQLAGRLGMNPREVAEILTKAIEKKMEIEKGKSAEALIESLEIAGPGFINIRICKSVLENAISESVEKGSKFGHSDHLGGLKIMMEFAHPNTHKAFHIGHLRNICLGESLVRFLESQGAHVFRANYQGDIGPHVAKCIWGMMNMPDKNGFSPIRSVEEARAYEAEFLTTPERKVQYLGTAYAYGGKAYEADKDGSSGVQDAVREINKKVYLKDPEIMPLWEVTRSWSLDYFEHTYKRFGSHFDHLFFESQMYERGAEIVKANIKGEGGKDVFEESDGATVFRGEDYGLHTRVFLTSEGNTTYEGKELANAETQYATFNFDKIVHIVANEQAGYFKVVFKAIELIKPELENKQVHISYGMVNLSSGKMSSRTGDVVTAESLIDDSKERIEKILRENGSDLSDSEKKEMIEKVALGAVKFTMLHADSKRDIAFDMEQSLKLTGDSGPYLQYGYTRIVSILNKVEGNETAGGKKICAVNFSLFNDLDWELSKQLLRFEEEITKSADEFTTHNTAHYLVSLVSEFSRWYENNRVADSEEGLKAARIQLLKSIKVVLANGLHLLGIETVERM